MISTSDYFLVDLADAAASLLATVAFSNESNGDDCDEAGADEGKTAAAAAVVGVDG